MPAKGAYPFSSSWAFLPGQNGFKHLYLRKFVGGPVNEPTPWQDFFYGTPETAFTYAGGVSLSLIGSYSSILDRVFTGGIQAIMLPSVQTVLDRLYAGAVSFQNAPESTISTVTAVYTGEADFNLLPAIEAEIHAVYSGSVATILTPSGIYGRGMAYSGTIGLVVSPSGLYSLQVGGLHQYQGNVNLIAIPTSARRIRFAYSGNLPVGLVNSIQTRMQKSFAGNVAVEWLPVSDAVLNLIFNGSVPLYFAPVGTDSMIPDASMTCTPFILPGRVRMFNAWHTSAAKIFIKKGQDRIKKAKKDKKTFIKKGKKRIFEVKHGKLI